MDGVWGMDLSELEVGAMKNSETGGCKGPIYKRKRILE